MLMTMATIEHMAMMMMTTTQMTTRMLVMVITMMTTTMLVTTMTIPMMITAVTVMLLMTMAMTMKVMLMTMIIIMMTTKITMMITVMVMILVMTMATFMTMMTRLVKVIRMMISVMVMMLVMAMAMTMFMTTKMTMKTTTTFCDADDDYDNNDDSVGDGNVHDGDEVMTAATTFHHRARLLTCATFSVFFGCSCTLIGEPRSPGLCSEHDLSSAFHKLGSYGGELGRLACNKLNASAPVWSDECRRICCNFSVGLAGTWPTKSSLMDDALSDAWRDDTLLRREGSVDSSVDRWPKSSRDGCSICIRGIPSSGGVSASLAVLLEDRELCLSLSPPLRSLASRFRPFLSLSLMPKLSEDNNNNNNNNQRPCNMLHRLNRP